MDAAYFRLQNQHLVGKKPVSVKDLISSLGAMQAQDFYGAKWSLGLRMSHATDSLIEDAFNKGEILRTHVMRPTWHFVAPEDIRWILMLTAPRVHAYNGYYYRKSGLDKSIFQKTNKIIQKALEGKKQLTRAELNTILKKSKIPTDSLGLSYTIMQAELDGIICSGPRAGKQFTYMLLSERMPKAKSLEREEALAELVKRYFVSHGPATIADFVWWSGLTASDTKIGLEMNKKNLASETIGGKIYWFNQNISSLKLKIETVLLLPTFDEYLIAYKDRSAAYEQDAKHEKAFKDGFWNTIIVKGKIIGSWRRILKKNTVHIFPHFFRALNSSEKTGLQTAVGQYAAFLGMKGVLSI